MTDHTDEPLFTETASYGPMPGEEPIYRVTYLTGEMKLKPIEHRATWTSHDFLDIQSDYVTITNFEPQFLYMLDNVTFTNERLPKKRAGWFERLFGLTD